MRAWYNKGGNSGGMPLMVMTNRANIKHDHFIYTTLDCLVPQDHMVRKLEEAIDWKFIYPLVDPLYSEFGRPSIDPVVLFKMILINYCFGYNSMRRTCREIEVNMAYRWFLGYAIDEQIPNYSTWSQNYIRRYGSSEIFDQIFTRVLQEAMDCKFVKLDTVFGDGTHMKASANRRKSTSAEVEVAKKDFEDDLLAEINRDRKEHGKSKMFDSLKRTEYDFDEETGEQIEVVEKKTIKQSTTDPESGNFHKGDHEECFAYEHQTFCDRNGFVICFDTVPGNVHDSVSFFPAYQALRDQFGSQIKNICLDAGYKTPAIAREILLHGHTPFFPYKRPMTKKGFFRKHEYVYDEQYDCYLCPNNQVLSYTTTDRQGYRHYKSDPAICSTCPLRNQCTESKGSQKDVLRHVWADYMEKAEEVRYTEQWKKIYPQRKESIERVFADDKENHCLRYTRVRGLKKNRHVGSIIYTCHNLERLARWKWKDDSHIPSETLRFVILFRISHSLLA
jgi:transposase/transcription elongation factor Elf1